MGCLLEFLFEFVLEGVIELLGYGYIKLMTLIVPDKAITEKTKKKIKTAVTAVAADLVVVLIIGLTFLIQSDPVIKIIGKYMTFIPLGIMAVQIILGIIVQIVSRLKK